MAPKWRALAATDDEAARLFDRKVGAQRFIRFKSEGNQVPVTDAEALNYFQKNRQEFGKASFSKVREPIKRLLTNQLAETRLNEWYTILDEKYKVKRVYQ